MSEEPYLQIRWDGAVFGIDTDSNRQWRCDYAGNGISGSLVGPNVPRLIEDAARCVGFTDEIATQIIFALQAKMRERLFH